MKAISKREHTALIAALRQLEDLSTRIKVTASLERKPADGFLQHAQSLNERFSHYEDLLSQLSDCIAEYEAMYKEVRVNIVGPGLRQVKKEVNISQQNRERYQLVVEYAKVASGV